MSIEVRNVSKNFNAFKALDNISQIGRAHV